MIFRSNRKFGIKIIQLLIVEEFKEILIKNLALAISDLLNTDKNFSLVGEKQQKLFHRLVFTIYYYTLRERKNPKLATVFLTTKVENFN